MAHILEVEKITKVFTRRGGGRVLAVDNVTFSVEEGRSTIIAVAGESGSGKTTLALLMMGQHEPTSGTVRYRGTDLAHMSAEERAQLRREIQPIYQDPYGAYNPYYRVDHVLEMPIARYNLAESKAEAERKIGRKLSPSMSSGTGATCTCCAGRSRPSTGTRLWISCRRAPRSKTSIRR